MTNQKSAVRGQRSLNSGDRDRTNLSSLPGTAQPVSATPHSTRPRDQIEANLRSLHQGSSGQRPSRSLRLFWMGLTFAVGCRSRTEAEARSYTWPPLKHSARFRGYRIGQWLARLLRCCPFLPQTAISQTRRNPLSLESGMEPVLSLFQAPLGACSESLSNGSASGDDTAFPRDLTTKNQDLSSVGPAKEEPRT